MTLRWRSSVYTKQNNLFKEFTHWREGYTACTDWIKEKDQLIEYVKKQEEQHKKITFRDEFIAMLNEHPVTVDEKYLF